MAEQVPASQSTSDDALTDNTDPTILLNRLDESIKAAADAERSKGNTTPSNQVKSKKGSTDDDHYNIGRDGEFVNAPDDETSSGDTASATDIVNYISSLGQKVNLEINEGRNILDDYANYTYNFDLYMLSPDVYNKMMADPDDISQFDQANLLMISSGDKRNGVGRNKHFTDTFYMDDVEMKTIVPTTGTSMNTNVTSIKFKIIEPYGVTLLERLEKMVADIFQDGRPKMYAQVPYLLKVTFKGYDDDGNPRNIENSTRYIPIKLTNITFNVSEGGATYDVSGIPYNQEVMNNIHISLPQMIDISGETIGDFLNNEQAIYNTEERTEIMGADDLSAGEAITIRTTTRTGTAKNLQMLINEYQAGLAGKTPKGETSTMKSSNPEGSNKSNTEKKIVDIPDKVSFEFYEDIRKSKIKYEDVQIDQIKNYKEFQGNEFLKSYAAAINPLKNRIDINKNSIRVNQKTSIVKVIEILMLHSDYIQDQLFDGKSLRRNVPLKWFKVTPKIKILGWDEKKGRFAYHITYFVSPYQIFNINFKKAPRGGARGTGYHREYNYIFTGKNDNVLDFDIKYNLAYYRQTTVGKGDERSDEPKDGGNGDEGNGSSDLSTPTVPSPGAVAVSGGLSQKGQDGKALTARDLARTVLTEGPEMMGLKLEILGDPGYIMQSEIFRQKHLVPTNKLSMDSVHSEDNTINYDFGDILIKMNFKFPVDYGDDGLMDLGNSSNTEYRTSDQFSGTYRVTHLDNTFSGGQFTQTLRGVRLLDYKDESSLVERALNTVINSVKGELPKSDNRVEVKEISSDFEEANYGITTDSESFITVGRPREEIRNIQQENISRRQGARRGTNGTGVPTVTTPQTQNQQNRLSRRRNQGRGS